MDPTQQNSAPKPDASSFPSEDTGGASPTGAPSGSKPANQDELTLLALNTSPRIVGECLTVMRQRAMEEDREAKRAGHFLLSLWDSSRWTFDLEEVSYFQGDLNKAARHIVNFLLCCHLKLSQVITYREIQPIIAAWGEGE